MPSKKKKYNARFPAGRIKKIMQSDEEIGKVAQAVPVIISRTLELFVESLLTKTLKITNSRNAKTLSTSHMKQCIMSEQRFDFLRELVKNIPDISVAEEAANYNEEDAQSSPEEQYPDSDTPYDLSMPSTSRSTQAALKIHTNGDNALSSRMLRSQNGNMSMRSHAGVSSEISPYTLSNAHLKRSTDHIKSHLQHHIAGSVIMHTSASSDCLPPKLSRSESTPANALQHGWPQTHSYQQRQRLKHQPHSMPNSRGGGGGAGATAAACSRSSTTTCSQPKQQKLETTLPQTAIPAPIVSFDFCNKPVVKIDYSNLPMPAIESVTPHTAPAATNVAAHSNSTTSAFDFSTAPVINIDLSNIVANTAVTTNATSSNGNGGSAVATISIAGMPTTIAAHNETSSATVATPSNSSKKANDTSSKSFFELDEDYDNI